MVDYPIRTSLPQPRLSKKSHWGSAQTISYLMQQAVENPDVISLAAGLVDYTSLPVNAVKSALTRLMDDEAVARQVLQYGTTHGAERLRDQLLHHLAHLEGQSVTELDLNSNQLVLTTGSQQLLSIIGEVLLDPEDICLVAAPTYFVFLSVLDGLGAKAVPIETDEHGIIPASLEHTLITLKAAGSLSRVKLLYLVSYYENPSGLSLVEQRRKAVMELVQHWTEKSRLFVLEDAAYRELRYDGPVLPSLWSYDPDRQTVILAQTFSKSLSPGLRVGYGVIPDELMEPVCNRKGTEDFGSANFNQHLVASLMESGLYQKHVHDLCAAYQSKRDAMLEAADEYFTDLAGVDWVHPHGGLYVWMSLPESVPTGFVSALFDRAVHTDKVMYVPGELFYTGPVADRPRHQMRLSYGVQDCDGIRLGMQRLANAVRSVL